MSSHLGASGNLHTIEVDKTADELERQPHSRFTHPVDLPSLWHPGDRVMVQTSDKQRFMAQVLDVSMVTNSVLIELD